MEKTITINSEIDNKINYTVQCTTINLYSESLIKNEPLITTHVTHSNCHSRTLLSDRVFFFCIYVDDRTSDTSCHESGWIGGWVLLPVAAGITAPNNRSNHTRFIRQNEDNPNNRTSNSPDILSYLRTRFSPLNSVC